MVKKKTPNKKPNLRTDFTGSKFGSFLIKRYVSHVNNSPQWEAECEYCNSSFTDSISKIKAYAKERCECEESMRWFGNLLIPNNIVQIYKEKAKLERVPWELDVVDIYKIYSKQNGLDKHNKKLIFDYHWNYNRNPATCNYIWPDMIRINKSKSYNLSNCELVANYEQRFKRSIKNKK